ncbi:hypothetical protein CRG98_012583 [Punica granatum]|uniref:Gnk2-homologous domain-containing protein n=1 Tax=Punica granatum TaxID=22663 RepID=A0A2I0KEW6_PUNGR|nr:hypothetical protein CRG98_012583 [Punica granatum]
MASLLGFFSASVRRLLCTSSISLLFLLFNCLAIPTRINAYCYNDRNFTAHSTYAKNRRHLLSSLHSNVTADGGFFSGSLGTGPNTVYALSFCRGDLAAQNRRAIVNSTAIKLMESCPYQKQGIRYEDSCCIVRYSDRPINGILDMSINEMAYNTRNLSLSWDDFNQTWWNHMENLTAEASKGSELLPRKVGRNYTSFAKLLFAVGSVQLLCVLTSPSTTIGFTAPSATISTSITPTAPSATISTAITLTATSSGCSSARIN